MRKSIESWCSHAKHMSPVPIMYYGDISEDEKEEILERGYLLKIVKSNKSYILVKEAKR